VPAGLADEYTPENTSGRIRSTATKAAIEHNVRTKKNFTPQSLRIDFSTNRDSGLKRLMYGVGS
jgi:hypothetical protein